MRKFFKILFVASLFFPIFTLAQEEIPIPEITEPGLVLPLTFSGGATSTFITTCQFSNPIYWDSTDRVFRNLVSPPAPPHYNQLQNWNFLNISCTTTDPEPTSTDPYIYISNGTTGFYLNQSWDYGTLLIAFFLFLGILAIITERIFFFFFNKFTSITREKK